MQERAVYLGPIYLDYYNGLQYALAAGALVSLMVGSLVVMSAALRAVLQRRFAGGFVLSISAVFIPVSVVLTLVIGPWLEQLWSWGVYQWITMPSYAGHGYGYGYGYGYTMPWLPDISMLYYGISIGQSLAMGGAAVAMTLLGLAAHLLMPLRSPAEIPAHEEGPT